MRLLPLTVAMVVVMNAVAAADPIPQAAIDELIKSYKAQGISLAKMYSPDFSKVYPNTGLRYTPCYPGKKLLVLTLTPDKPQQWVFRVKYGDNKDIPVEHQPDSIVLAGKTYWFDYRATGFAADFSDHSDNCLFVLAMDQRAHRMPIYTFLLTKPGR